MNIIKSTKKLTLCDIIRQKVDYQQEYIKSKKRY